MIVPSTKRAGGARPDSTEYDRVFRRYLTAEIFLAARGPARDLRNGGKAFHNGRVGHADQPRPAPDRDRTAHADRPALKLDDTVVNYAVLNEGATRIAGLLKEKGIEPGDRVGIMLPNVPYFAIVYYGILRAGGVVVPMNVLLKGREVAFYLKDSGAKIVFAWHDFGEAATAGAEEAGTEVIHVKPGEFEQLVMDAPRAPRRTSRARATTPR